MSDTPLADGRAETLRHRVEGYYDAIAPKLLAFLVANGCEHALACDIVQETFLRIWKMREDLCDELAQVSGLAFTIAKNLRTDKARKSSRETLQEEIRDGESADSDDARTDGAAYEPPTVPSDTAYLRRRLAEAFAQLPPLLREAYTLFQIQELPIREIARRTNASESLVKVRIFRAKEKLRPLLADLTKGAD